MSELNMISFRLIS